MKVLWVWLTAQLQLMLPTIGLLTLIVLFAWQRGWLKLKLKFSKSKDTDDSGDDGTDEKDTSTMKRRDDALITQMLQMFSDTAKNSQALLQQIVATQATQAEVMKHQTDILVSIQQTQKIQDFQLQEIFKRVVH